MILIIDGHNFIYKAFHAVPDIVSSDGRHTNAIIGLLKMLDSAISTHKPTHMVFTIDPRSGSTARKKLFPEYKANRGTMPPELVEQFPYIRKLVKAYGITIISKKGVEADDIVGTLANKFSKHSIKILTSDKDMVQLVNDNVTVIDKQKKLTLDVDGVKDKYGITPSQFCEYLALIGDISDNIPGVSGIGPKTALGLLQEYRSVKSVYANLSKLTPSLKGNLRGEKEKFKLSLKLVTIDKNIDINVKINNIIKKPKNNKKVDSITKSLGISHKVGPIKSF